MIVSLRIYLYYLLFLITYENENFTKKAPEIQNDSIKILAYLYEKLYNSKNNLVYSIINKFKSELENIPNFNGLIYNRIKSPLSIYKKFFTSNDYQKSWNSIKDLLGFMVIVDTHSEIDYIISYLKNKYSKFKFNLSNLFSFHQFYFEYYFLVIQHS